MGKVVKEGGKRGVEIEGAADRGGHQDFCTSVDESQGDLDLMDHCIAAMNAQPVPGEEERKGYSGHIGKMIFSAGDHQLGVVAYVPADKKGELDATEWLKQTLSIFQGELADGCSDLYARGFITADGNTNKFPLKMKEPCITEAITILKKKGLFPDHDSDDDEMVFGDDDFPSADDEAEAPAEAPSDPPAQSPTAYVPKADLTPDQQKNLKKVVKEGGKRGVEIEGAADMGGLQYFCTSVDESQGDLDLLDHCIAAMNAQPVP